MAHVIVRPPWHLPDSAITPESAYHGRREFLRALGFVGGGLAVGLPALAQAAPQPAASAKSPAFIPGSRNPDFNPTLRLSDESVAVGYNNYYEFSTTKTRVRELVGKFRTDPWTIDVGGLCEKPMKLGLPDLLAGFPQEERVYRFRCVEAWSMVVPWMGVPLARLLAKFEPNGNAKYVEFTTLKRPKEMPGQRGFGTGIDWPYVEGLRMDEAMHPLALMVTGLYGKPLPKQNGAPWRLMVPWKYGFKSGKSIVKIRFTRTQPRTSWNVLAPQEYGFYANVNPAVDHPRWSQARERRLPSTLFSPNWRETLPFNGYAEEVASLYTGMNLARFY